MVSYIEIWRKNNPAKMKQYSLNSAKRRKIENKRISNKLKINGCAICGYNKCNIALDFHHSNPKDKKFNIIFGKASSFSNENLTDELNKCILLCKNCHSEIEYLEIKNG